MDKCLCMAESLQCSLETTTQLIGYTPTQTKKFKVGGQKLSSWSFIHYWKKS